MVYRELGKTGCKTSVIGLGGEHLDGRPYEEVRPVIDAALDCGVNIIDVFMPGRSVRENIANALGARRKDVMIQGHIGSTDINQQYDISRDLPTVKKFFEEELRLFGGYIDFGMMFFIDSDEDYKGVFETGFADYVASLKQAGSIGHIGFSSHNPATAARAIATGLPEMMMFSINPAFDMVPADQNTLDTLQDGFDASAFRGIDPKRAALYRLCEQKGIGITVMKPLGAGKLISAEHTPFAQPMTVAQCLHYALTRPAVASALLGCRTAAELYDAVRYNGLPDEEKDYSAAIGTMKNDFAGQCVYCGHCQPCPAGIDVAAVNKYLDIALLDEAAVPPSIRQHYGALGAAGADCIACGSCEERCPFDVPVMDRMARAARLFG